MLSVDQHLLWFCFRPRKSRAHPTQSKTGTPTAAATRPESKKASATYVRSSSPSHVSGENQRQASAPEESSVGISFIVLYLVRFLSCIIFLFLRILSPAPSWVEATVRYPCADSVYSPDVDRTQPPRTRAREEKRFAFPRGRSAMSPGTSYRLVNVRSASVFSSPPTGRST